MEREVSASSSLFRAVDVADDPSTAAHSSDCRIRYNLADFELVASLGHDFPIVSIGHIVFKRSGFTGLIITVTEFKIFIPATVLERRVCILDFLVFVLNIREVERRVNTHEVRIEPAGETFDGLEIQVIVRVTLVLGIALHELEDENRENRSKPVTHALVLGTHEVPAHHSPAVRRVEAEVNGGERNLVTGTALQRIQVVHEGFHGLMRFDVGHLDGLVDTLFREAVIVMFRRAVHSNIGKELAPAALVSIVVRVTGKVLVSFVAGGIVVIIQFDGEMATKAAIDRRGKVEVEVVARDAAILLVRLELENHCGQGGGTLDRVSTTDESGTGIKT